MEDFTFDINVQGTLRAYTREDAEDQVKKFLSELGGYRGYMAALEPCGIHFNIRDLVSAGIIGESAGPAGSAAKELITRKDLLHLLLEQHESHQMPSWRWNHKSVIENESHLVSLLVAFADIDHQQWQYWSHDIATMLEQAERLLRPGIIEEMGFDRRTLLIERGKAAERIRERLERWEILWETPYLNLTDEQKNQDLKWADKSMAVIQNHLAEGWPH